MASSGTMMPKKPAMWIKRMMASNIGRSQFAPVVMTTANAMMAQNRMVACQL